MTKYKLVHNLALVAVIALSACVKAQKKDINTENESGRSRSFRLSKSGDLVDVTGYNKNLLVSNDIDLVRKADVDVISEHARFSKRREYNLKMCGLADVRGNGSILGQKFRVYSELEIYNNDLTVQTDGCLYWQVSIPFNYFGDSVNLDINFIFKSEKGMAYIHKTTFFNPWDSRRGDNPEFFDYTRFGLSDRLLAMPWARGIDEIEQALSGKLLKTVKKLEIGSVTVVPVQKNKQNFVETNLIGTDISQELDSKYKNEELRTKLNGGNKVQSLDLHLNVRLDNLKIRLFDTAGVNKDESLTTGRYKIYAQLVATDQASRGHYIISDKLNVSNTKEWATSTMGVNAVLPISLVIRPQWGNLNLLLKVVPVDIPGVQPFEALYQLGRFDEIKGGKSPLFDLSEYTVSKESDYGLSFSYDDYLKRSANFKDWEKGLAEQGVGNVSTLEKGFRRFLFSQLDVLFSRIMPGDTSTDRTIQYTVETCLTDNFTGAQPGAGLKFEIVTVDRGVEYKTLRQTNDLGCLTWVGMISHKYYHRENLVKQFSKLTYLGEDSDKPSYTLDYYINPWDEKFTFGRDARRLTPEYLEQIKKTQEAAPPTRVLISSFNYDATGFRYAIDRYMNMTVKKTVLMTIHPVILKYNSIVWGRSGLSDVRDGIYLLKVAMQKDYLDPMANKGLVVTNDLYPSKRDGSNLKTMTQEESENLEKKQFLVVKETLVRVLGGKIVTPIEFEINDLRTLRIRSQMLIQIETIDEMKLRAALIANEKLNGLLKESKSSQAETIMGLQATLSELEADIAKLKLQKDYQIMAEYIDLIKNEKDAREQILDILDGLNKETAEKIIAQLDEIRKLGESAVSADRNIKHDAINSAILSMKQKIGKAAAKQEKQVEESVVKTKLDECKTLMSNLINQGKTKEAELYDPNKADQDGYLCKTKIAKEELFYYLTNSDQAGSDSWFQALLTPDEFALYKSNLLKDDFTKPYPPAFDFSLLSNQGDERFDDQGKPREVEIDQEISGLPRRTFIGPVTFVLNGNGSAMRPTDVLDENSCNNTCEALSPVEKQVMDGDSTVKNEIKQFGDSVNSLYENSPYYGSIEHFYKKQVNDLQVVDRGLKFQYHQEMKAFSQVGNFLDQFLLNYVSFGDSSDVNKLDFKCYAGWKSEMEESYRKWRSGDDLSFSVKEIGKDCYVKSGRAVSKKNFIERVNQKPRNSMSDVVIKMNRFLQSPVTASEFKEFSKNGLMSITLSYDSKINILHKMCALMRQQLYPQDKSFVKTVNDRIEKTLLTKIANMNYHSEYRHVVDKIQLQCHELVDQFDEDMQPILSKTKDVAKINAVMQMKAIQLPIVVERRLRVLETSNKYLYKDGKTLNYSVGTGFSTSHAMNVNRGYKLDPIEVLEKTGSTGILGLVGKAAGSILGAVSGMINFQWGAGESLSVSDGASVGENTTLAAQISTLDIELSKWEKCVVVRFEENFLKEAFEDTRYLKITYIRPSEDIKGLGYFLCSGDKDTTNDMDPGHKIRVRERYFYLTQIFNEGDMQDPGALANHPWMLQLRGMRDFGRFEKALKKPLKEVDWSSPMEYMSKDLYSAIQLGSDIKHNDRSSMEVVNRDDIAAALKLMSVSFDRVMPTFPGMYTYSDTPYDNVIGWPK